MLPLPTRESRAALTTDEEAHTATAFTEHNHDSRRSCGQRDTTVVNSLAGLSGRPGEVGASSEDPTGPTARFLRLVPRGREAEPGFDVRGLDHFVTAAIEVGTRLLCLIGFSLEVIVDSTTRVPPAFPFSFWDALQTVRSPLLFVGNQLAGRSELRYRNTQVALKRYSTPLLILSALLQVEFDNINRKSIFRYHGLARKE
jgi:hypothetical protein